MRPFRSRRSWGWSAAISSFLVVIFTLLISTGSLVAQTGSKGGKGGRKKHNFATPQPSGSPGEQNLTNIPLPIGHEAKGLVLPDFDAEGHLQGKFVAGTARRIDVDHVGFKDLKITTFDDQNQVDLQIDLLTSVLNLKTRILTSQERAVVKRADFNIVGDSVEFDTNSRTGRMVGNVKMIITDQSHLMEKPNQ